MKIVTLLENTASGTLCHAHGLSLYIETPRHNILFDMGPNAGFLENAESLGVDISAVDIAFLSHGHDDHTGGLSLFCKRNAAAKIYLHRLAFGEYYAFAEGRTPHYIGIDPHCKALGERLVFTDGVTKIDSELQLFSDIRTSDYPMAANRALREKSGEDYPQDCFAHEQNLLISTEGKTLLIAGCAHRGIVNILRRAEEILGKSPDYVFSGFHLMNPTTGKAEDPALVAAVGEELKARPTRYFTGHCTGDEAFSLLQAQLGARLTRISGGKSWTL